MDPNIEYEILRQKVCYYSSPEYQNTFRGKFIYIYECKGAAIITNKRIRYFSRKSNFEIPISSIIEIKIYRFRRYQKPAELQYLAITYFSPEVRTVLLVPTESAFMAVWNTNKIVQEWFHLLQQLRVDNRLGK